MTSAHRTCPWIWQFTWYKTWKEKTRCTHLKWFVHDSVFSLIKKAQGDLLQ